MAGHIKIFILPSRYLSTSRTFSNANFLCGSTNLVFDSTLRKDLHRSATCALPHAEPLPLPDNIQDINASEVGRFSPLRSRDISGSVISTQSIENSSAIDITVDSDPHMEPYDCRGAVSLSSSMQSNVPSPFGGGHCFLGMPGSQWGQGHKFLAEHLQSSHYLNLRHMYSRTGHSAISGTVHTPGQTKSPTAGRTTNSINFNILNSDALHMIGWNRCYGRGMSTDASQRAGDAGAAAPSRAQKLKQAVATYGSTVIVFHVSISLISLGSCYLLVSSGLDVMAWMDHLGFSDSAFSKNVAANAGTFVVAYAVHKVFAPVRIGITLTATPFIVKYLRSIGILKHPVKP